MRRAPCLCTLLAAALLAAPAAAATPAGDVRARARVLGGEALSLFDSGKYAEALAQFERADAVFLAPTHGLMAARCLEKLGRLVEASGRYLTVTNIELDAKASPVFREAKVDAAKELQALLPRIPTLTVDVVGVPASGVMLTIDGKPQQSSGPSSVDPGRHRVEARQGDAVLATTDVEVVEGEARRVALQLPASRPSGPTAVPDAAASDAPPAQTQRLLGWAGVGLGGAGLLLGGIAGALAIGAQGDLDDSGCVDGACPVSSQDDVDGYNTLRGLSTGGFIAGGLLLAGGAALLWTAPKGAEQGAAAARVEPWIGVGSVGVRGSF